MKFRTLNADELQLRIGGVYAQSKGVTLLLYKDARADMRVLDETVGGENWQKRYYEVKGNLFCSVGIRIEGEWVWKDDCGTESNTEKEKGEASDAFKRACVNWGIGRELYTAPFIWLGLPDNAFENGKLTGKWQKQVNRLSVSEIEYTDGKITKLIIIDKDGNVAWQM